ncbi:hypothetical protein [Enterobacter sp. MALB-1]|uniref:hypothetical protein n=1 Tax=Enterobacter sp. MALB-1 TaxID=3153561 RepID=UPI0034DAE0D7
MKGQDLLLLSKIICLGRLTARDLLVASDNDSIACTPPLPDAHYFDSLNAAQKHLDFLFTIRGLSDSLGFSKSEVNNSFYRCLDVNLIKIDRSSNKPAVNKKVLFNFIKYGLRLVFPVKPGRIERGLPTTFAAPILSGRLLSGGELIMVWPDPLGKEMGQAITPLYKSVPYAVKQDPELYAYLALMDAVRLGNPREMKVALELLEEKLFHADI